MSAELVDDDGDERDAVRGRRAGDGPARRRRRARPRAAASSRSSCGTTAASCSAASAQETSAARLERRRCERELRFRVDRLPLADGRFHLRFALADAETGRPLHTLDDAVAVLRLPGRRRRPGAVLLDGDVVVAGDRPGRANSRHVSARACPDWPSLMEVAPDLQFRHYTLAEAHLPVDAFVQLEGIAGRRDRSLLRSRRARLQSGAHRSRASPKRCKGTHWIDVRELSGSSS